MEALIHFKSNGIKTFDLGGLIGKNHPIDFFKLGMNGEYYENSGRIFKAMKKIVVAIDASSIVNTGGLTHLYELLNNFNKQEHPEIKKIIVISSEKVLKNLPNKIF